MLNLHTYFFSKLITLFVSIAEEFTKRSSCFIRWRISWRRQFKDYI